MNKILKGALVVVAVILMLGLGAPVNSPLMLDEDDMVSDENTCTATQQSIKAYSDSGTQTMTNKTLTSPVINTGVSGTAFLDEDNMASDSATKFASQQSIKKYVDDNATATKEVFYIYRSSGTPSTLDDWDYQAVGSTGQIKFVFLVPNDFTSLISASMVVVPDATETVQWDNDASVAAVGEDYNADTRQSLNETQAVTINDITELDVSATLTGLTAGDLVGLRIQSDTDTLRPIGLRIQYN